MVCSRLVAWLAWFCSLHSFPRISLHPSRSFAPSKLVVILHLLMIMEQFFEGVCGQPGEPGSPCSKQHCSQVHWPFDT